MSEYKKLHEEFDIKVKLLQDTCPHTKTSWCEYWHAIGHGSEYQVLICDNCMKTLEEKPSPKFRKKAEKAWLAEQAKMQEDEIRKAKSSKK